MKIFVVLYATVGRKENFDLPREIIVRNDTGWQVKL